MELHYPTTRYRTGKVALLNFFKTFSYPHVRSKEATEITVVINKNELIGEHKGWGYSGFIRIPKASKWYGVSHLNGPKSEAFGFIHSAYGYQIKPYLKLSVSKEALAQVHRSDWLYVFNFYRLGLDTDDIPNIMTLVECMKQSDSITS